MSKTMKETIQTLTPPDLLHIYTCFPPIPKTTLTFSQREVYASESGVVYVCMYLG